MATRVCANKQQRVRGSLHLTSGSHDPAISQVKCMRCHTAFGRVGGRQAKGHEMLKRPGAGNGARHTEPAPVSGAKASGSRSDWQCEGIEHRAARKLPDVVLTGGVRALCNQHEFLGSLRRTSCSHVAAISQFNCSRHHVVSGRVDGRLAMGGPRVQKRAEAGNKA